MNNFWLKKAGWLGGIFLLVLLFNLNKSGAYQSETDILILPKNETVARNLDSVVGNFQQILTTLAFNDRLSDGSEALAQGVDLPNYKRKEFWNSKLAVERMGASGVIRIKNFDTDSSLAQELNSDTVENLITIASNYYNVRTDLELRIIDGPIMKKIVAQNLILTIAQSVLWSVLVYLILFLLFPFIFIKKEEKKRAIPGRDFSRNIPSLQKPLSAVLPEEENYFATKNFFGQAKKVEKVSIVEKTVPQKNSFSLPTFPSFGKKAPTPANLPVSEDAVPDIFRQKEVAIEEVEKEITAPTEKSKTEQEEYISREATPEEVKARLNRLLGGGK
ncbi:MAG: hypothetical protein NTY33_01415 [Candidatus Moranbacteria bacterium]|nr:hypothetical protein [Candidatus Moranbacteria bacterium]